MDVVRVLLDRPDIDVNSRNNRGMSALYIAAKKGDLDAVRLLLARPEISVTCREHGSGRTAIHAAIFKAANMAVISALLEHPKTNVQDTDRFGWTPLHYATCDYGTG